jgi:hypothetical protein
MKGWCEMRNRIFDVLPPACGTDGAFTFMGKRSAVSEAASTEAAPDVAGRLAALLTEVIGKKWNRKDAALAKAAGIHPSGLSVLKTKGTATVTPSLRSVCGVIGVDADALIEGRVEEIEPMSRRPDLHAMLESVVGTPDELAVEQVLRAFIKARKH